MYWDGPKDHGSVRAYVETADGGRRYLRIDDEGGEIDPQSDEGAQAVSWLLRHPPSQDDPTVCACRKEKKWTADLCWECQDRASAAAHREYLQQQRDAAAQARAAEAVPPAPVPDPAVAQAAAAEARAAAAAVGVAARRKLEAAEAAARVAAAQAADAAAQAAAAGAAQGVAARIKLAAAQVAAVAAEAAEPW